MQPWQKQADGSLLRAIENLRMIVHPNAINGDTRFVLIREAGNGPGYSSAMIASGHEQSVGSAITVVEKMAAGLRERVSSAGS
jgi:hypothetical protein